MARNHKNNNRGNNELAELNKYSTQLKDVSEKTEMRSHSSQTKEIAKKFVDVVVVSYPKYFSLLERVGSTSFLEI